MMNEQNLKIMNYSTVAELKKYVGDLINYAGYTLRVSEVSASGATVYEPNSGMTATISLEKFASIIHEKFATV